MGWEPQNCCARLRSILYIAVTICQRRLRSIREAASSPSHNSRAVLREQY